MSNLPRISTDWISTDWILTDWISTDNALEDAPERRAFFKGQTATAATFLIARLTIFVAFFQDSVAMEEIDLEGKDKPDRVLDEERDNGETWWLIVKVDGD